MANSGTTPTNTNVKMAGILPFIAKEIPMP